MPMLLSAANYDKLQQLRADHAALRVHVALLKLELAYDRAVKAEARAAAADPFEEMLTVSAGLSLIEGIMKGAENITQSAAEDHLHNFKQQMRDTFGLRVVVPDEPYLPVFLKLREIEFLTTLGRLFDRVDSAPWPLAEKHFLHHSPMRLEFKALTPGQSLFGQIETRLESETLRHAQRLSQGLDRKRQQAIGLRKYVWRTRGDSKVRTAHAVNDGKIFDWRNPPASGHPGDDFGCRCWAEPSLNGAGDAYFEPGDAVQVAGLIKGAIDIIRWFTAKRAAREAAEQAARNAARKPKPPPPAKRPQPRLDDTKTWPSPPKQSKYKEGEPSRIKPHASGEKSLYDKDGGEWRYSPEDKYHNPHWDYKPSGKAQEWQNVPIENLPILK
jgi:SPP1 gp7 family putative phage head morphogenesis protein